MLKFDKRQPVRAPPPSGSATTLDRERVELDKSAKALEADRAALGPAAEQKAKAFEPAGRARAGGWRLERAQCQAEPECDQTLEVDLQNWKIDCEGKKNREDDEKAILSGK